MAFGITPLSIITLCTTTLSIMTKNTAFSKENTHTDRAFIVMLIVVVLTFTMLSVIGLSIVIAECRFKIVVILSLVRI
jgi:hypothetical protein